MLLNMSSLCMKCFLVGSVVKNSPANAGLILGWEDILEEEMATHPSVLAGKIPWAEQPGGIQSVRLQRAADVTEQTCASISHIL